MQEFLTDVAYGYLEGIALCGITWRISVMEDIHCDFFKELFYSECTTGELLRRVL